ncbi:MAG: ABC transporter permease [Propionibacteriaceae bacterium]|jgi:putative ABC transport system permease protein|nr:ABC transporter permease [Propionibacteriaceae bacterium]
MLGAIDQGLITAVLALGVFLTFRILNFADLTVDGSFTAGTATTAILIFNGAPPVLATLAGMLVGAAAGCVTGLLHTKAHIDPLLSSILVMLAMYTVNTRIMWGGADGQHRSTVGLLNKPTIFTWLVEARLRGTAVSIAFIGAIVVVAVVFVNWYLSTKFGLAVMATGDNPNMASSMGINTDLTKIATLAVANGLVGLSGALTAQYTGSASIGDGTGMILVGLASVILGNAVFGTRFIWLMTVGVVAGSALYRVAIFFALRWEFLDNADMKLMSAALVVIALVLTQSKSAHALVTKLTPWRAKAGVPEPMTVEPNPFSPFAEVDSAVQSAVEPRAERVRGVVRPGDDRGGRPMRPEAGTSVLTAPVVPPALTVPPADKGGE